MFGKVKNEKEHTCQERTFRFLVSNTLNITTPAIPATSQGGKVGYYGLLHYLHTPHMFV